MASAKPTQPLIDKELGNTYLFDTDRFVVSLIIGYSDADQVSTAKEAAAAALELTRDLGSYDTHWYVHDRETGETVLLEQGDFEPEACLP